MNACTGTPVSWLRLELYHQGELADAERDAIADHLSSCRACAECLGHIREDDRALPPLPAPRRGRVLWIASGLALAAAAVLAIGRAPRGEEIGARVKGDGVAFTLVRQDEAVVADAAGVYREGDRWKALVTCPEGMRGAFDVAIYERGDASFPLEPASDLSCGNEIALPGAFRVTGGERLTVCLVWGENPLDREAIRRTPPELLPRAACKILEPAP